ncbi:unnamed protein product [Mycetohabitans rhizoxinica HKI 454]|uniref:Uncharacterized protein n=1 Tax=Mycetohabitans rhizoxinica (strain DSM 19002 / CIP 109453 / HKI 454) TaxID=882378 RepID=E5AKG0_MYCRK|nr:unnamed protein product [Mycetohabitans rhizoxinica HKI 454]
MVFGAGRAVLSPINYASSLVWHRKDAMRNAKVATLTAF